MEAPDNSERTLTFEQLVGLREQTEAIAQLLLQQLTAYLETLRPLLAPRRLLGKYTGVKEDVTGADRAFAQLQEKYKQLYGKPFVLPAELEERWLANVDNRLELHPWEYSHQVKSERETKTVTMTSPVRWVLTYSSGATLAQTRQTVASKEARRSDAVCQFVVNALVMHALLARYAGLSQILTDLHYQVGPETLPGLGELPLMTITSCLPSFRPPDHLILTATRFSGVPAFIELIDVEALPNLADPLKTRLAEILQT